MKNKIRGAVLCIILLVLVLSGCGKESTASYSDAGSQKYIYITFPGLEEYCTEFDVRITPAAEDPTESYDAVYVPETRAFALLLEQTGTYNVYFTYKGEEKFCQIFTVDKDNSIYFVPVSEVQQIEGGYNSVFG